MLFLVQWTIPIPTREAGRKRFQETGGMPGSGVKLIGRWHRLDGSGGLAIVETGDPIALGKWADQWADVITLSIHPVGDDAATQQILFG
jgi:hypothetical protein